jgi:hypothetical protein
MSDESNFHLDFELQGQRYHAILLSGGGNDLIDALHPGNGQPAIIVPCGANPPGAADSYVNAAALKALTDDVLAGLPAHHRHARHFRRERAHADRALHL